MPSVIKNGEPMEQEATSTTDARAENVTFTEADLHQVAEGKTKVIYEIASAPTLVLIRSKDKITAFDGKRHHDFEGKSSLSNMTTCKVFEYLKECGVRTHYKYCHTPIELIAERCAMIPLEFVARRIATGSFLKRNVGVKEGYRFAPLKLEIFYKDDALGDPQWTEEMVLQNTMTVSGIVVDSDHLAYMMEQLELVFELLERAWCRVGCTLVDMKIEFGINTEGDIVLADVIDSDSWRLWPNGDRRLQVDKQYYRDLSTVTDDDLSTLRKNFAWVQDKLNEFITPPKARVAILLGSVSDTPFAEQIRTVCHSVGVPAEIRISSAHKVTARTLNIIKEYEADATVFTVFVCVAGRSNGLGPVTAGNTVLPVINCPPITTSAWAAEDIWSSLRVPSGIGCTTVLSPESAALAAAMIISQHDHMVWARLRTRLVANRDKLRVADTRAQEQNNRELDQMRNRYSKCEQLGANGQRTAYKGDKNGSKTNVD